jgi:uncharacterized protein YlxP (DUF503 family)
MVVGVCSISLIIHDNHSLKGKRQVVKGICERVKNRFNVSIAEVGDNDAWQRATLGFSMVGNDKPFVNSALDKVVSFIEGMHTADVAGRSIELINL